MIAVTAGTDALKPTVRCRQLQFMEEGVDFLRGKTRKPGMPPARHCAESVGRMRTIRAPNRNPETGTSHGLSMPSAPRTNAESANTGIRRTKIISSEAGLNETSPAQSQRYRIRTMA